MAALRDDQARAAAERAGLDPATPLTCGLVYIKGLKGLKGLKGFKGFQGFKGFKGLKGLKV